MSDHSSFLPLWAETKTAFLLPSGLSRDTHCPQQSFLLTSAKTCGCWGKCVGETPTPRMTLRNL